MSHLDNFLAAMWMGAWDELWSLTMRNNSALAIEICCGFYLYAASQLESHRKKYWGGWSSSWIFWYLCMAYNLNFIQASSSFLIEVSVSSTWYINDFLYTNNIASERCHTLLKVCRVKFYLAKINNSIQWI